MSEQLDEIVSSLKELTDDNTIPKNVKLKLSQVLNILKDDSDLSLKVNKALSIFDEISDDSNLQAYTRTQVWNIVSLLEAL